MTKQIQVRDDVYALLAERKRQGESFSDLLERLARDKKDPWSFIGSGESELSVEERLKLADDLKGPWL